MSDAFFANGDAAQTLQTLGVHPDGVLVSEETVHDFQLQPGDTVSLRLQFATDHRVPPGAVHLRRGRARVPDRPARLVPRRERDYVAQATGSAAAQMLLIRTDVPPADGRRSGSGTSSGRRRERPSQDIVTQQRITLSGLTAIDLAGLTRLELAFALVLAAGASGLVLALGLGERRRTFAIASALGREASAAGGVRVERGRVRRGRAGSPSARSAGGGSRR